MENWNPFEETCNGIFTYNNNKIGFATVDNMRYDGEDDNELYNVFDKWNDVLWLRNFFIANKTDLWLNYARTRRYCNRIGKNRTSPSFPD